MTIQLSGLTNRDRQLIAEILRALGAPDRVSRRVGAGAINIATGDYHKWIRPAIDIAMDARRMRGRNARRMRPGN